MKPEKIPVRKLALPSGTLPSNAIVSIRRIQDIELFRQEGNAIHALHKHEFFFILIVEEGEGIHEIDFTNYQVSKHSVFFLRPGQVHKMELRPGCKGFLVEFNPAFYNPLDNKLAQRLRKAKNHNYCQFLNAPFRELVQLFDNLCFEYQQRDDGYEEVIRAGIDIFIILYLRQCKTLEAIGPASNQYRDERLDEFVDLLEKHIVHHKQVSDYASLMGLSLYQLNEITKSSVGKTASELINEHIILDAKRYLLATTSQVKEIADLLGYEDVSYFIRFFRKHSGFSPEAFRQHPGS